ncbi:MAG: SPOR domain-containing protein [Bacteroidales bacterium]|jgi:hypothetical protein|nr:SPOR domain-containing protein [Bacteroidales bacterium]MDN5350554.1 hypothetical protein [Bacteroidales bacterium]
MKLRNIFLLLLIFISFRAVKAQNPREGSLLVLQDSRLDSLLWLQEQLFKEQQYIEGFRIQVFMESGNDAVIHAQELMDKLAVDFPQWKTYLSYGQPYYRVHIGDFRDRLEAEAALQMLNRNYKQAFITRDRIAFPELHTFSTPNKQRHE